MEKIHYRNFNNLFYQVKILGNKIPKNFDIIVGIPRSGLLAANLLAIYLNVPFTDFESFIDGKILAGGSRIAKNNTKDFLKTKRNILIVDDSVATGSQILKIKKAVDENKVIHNIQYGTIFIRPDNIHLVDYFAEIVPSPRLFEWNILNHVLCKNMCFDVDGVLCRDPSVSENDDGEKYLNFINTVDPIRVPTVKIGWLVTCRLEKYRNETEKWLVKHNIQYNKLIMMDYKTKAERVLSGSHAKFKAQHYIETNAFLFVESSKIQAVEINKITKKPVFCIETWELIDNFNQTLFNSLLLLIKRIFIKVNKGIMAWIHLFR